MLTIYLLMHHVHTSFDYSLKHMHHTGSQETEVVIEPKEPEVVEQEATKVEEQEEEL
jgi:hypothetical protein